MAGTHQIARGDDDQVRDPLDGNEDQVDGDPPGWSSTLMTASSSFQFSQNSNMGTPQDSHQPKGDLSELRESGAQGRVGSVSARDAGYKNFPQGDFRAAVGSS